MYKQLWLIWITQLLMPNILAADQNLNLYLKNNSLSMCCPCGWPLIQIETGFFSGNRYECFDPATATKFSNIFQSFDPTPPVYGIHISPAHNEQNSNFSLSLCDRQVFAIFPGDFDVEMKTFTCLAQSENRIMAVSCPDLEYKMIHRLSFIHKCCPLDHVYNGIHKKCVPVETPDQIDYSIYNGLFEHSGFFRDLPLDCPREKVLVEYHLDLKDFRIEQSNLYLRRNDQSGFSIYDYCIEAYSPNQLDEHPQFLVRVCMDKTVCNHITCIRRCCTDGEMFMKGNATSYCKRDETDIAYHSFEGLEISGNFSKPKGNIFNIFIYILL